MEKLILLASMVVCCSGILPIPKGYVLDMKANCATTTTGRTLIQLLTDLDVHAEGACMDGHFAAFQSYKKAKWMLSTYYTGNSNERCILKKKSSTTYQLHLTISWAEPTKVKTNHESLLVTCFLDNNGGSKFRIENLNQRIQVQHHPRVSSSSLQLTNMNGHYIQKVAQVGDLIQLKAEITVSGEEDEKSLQAVDCAVVGGGSQYQILRGGCGTGFIIPENSSFVTRGRESKSQAFAAFRFDGNPTVSFFCNFTKCSTNCDGSSCRGGLKVKREAPHPRDMIQLQTRLQVRAATPVDAITVDPCRVPGFNPEDCKNSQSQAVSIDLPVSVTSFMMVVMVMFPMVFVISIVVFLCCPKNKNSYGITDPGT